MSLTKRVARARSRGEKIILGEKAKFSRESVLKAAEKIVLTRDSGVE